MNGDRAFSDVLQDLLANLQELVRSEMRLAKAEVREDFTLTLSAGLCLGLGVIGALGAGMLLLWTVVFALALVLPMWGATLVTCAITAAMAVVLIVVGRERLKQVRPGPDRTVENVKENLEWLKQSTR